MISTLHMRLADKLGAGHADCLSLAALANVAVDYTKSGVPAVIPRELRHYLEHPITWPHFMEKAGRKYYTSDKVLGDLHTRAAREGLAGPRHVEAIAADGRLLDQAPGYEFHLEEARIIRDQYNHRLMVIGRLYCERDEPAHEKFEYEEFDRTGWLQNVEASLLMGSVFQFVKRFDSRKYEVRDQVHTDVAELQTWARKVFNAAVDAALPESQPIVGAANTDVPRAIIEESVAAAWYASVYDINGTALGLLSFAWAARDPMLRLWKRR